MLLTEIFDKTVPWKWVTKPTPYVGRASFGVGDNKYVVTFEQDYMVVGVPTPDSGPTTQFLCRFRQTNTSKSKQFAITGAGHAFVVFGTVLEIIDAFKSAQPQASIRLTAEEPSRVRLYSRLLPSRYPGTNIEREGKYTIYTLPPKQAK